MRLKLAVILIPVIFAPLSIQAQSRAASARTAELAAMFTKHKHVVKEKRGATREKYKDVRSEPVIRSNPATYSGSYNADFGFALRLTVQPDGRVVGSGREPITASTNVARSFVLRDARVDGALLTGTIVYSDSHSQKLEGVFMNRTSRDSPSEPGYTVFGLGVITPPTQVDGLTVERLFYARSSL
jgi:hypothetical protein